VKLDIRLPGKGNSTSHEARPVHQKHRWIRSSRLSIKNALSLDGCYWFAWVIDSGVKSSREEKIALRGTDPESNIN